MFPAPQNIPFLPGWKQYRPVQDQVFPRQEMEKYNKREACLISQHLQGICSRLDPYLEKQLWLMWLLIPFQERQITMTNIHQHFYHDFVWKVTSVSSHAFIGSLVQNLAHIRMIKFSHCQTKELSGNSQPYHKRHFDLFPFKVKQDVQSFCGWKIACSALYIKDLACRKALKIKPQIGTWISQKYYSYAFPKH